MKRRIYAFTALTLAILLCASALGCSLVSVNEEKDMARIAAKVGDIEITKGEVNEQYQMYLPYASMSGFDTSTAAGRKEMATLLLEDIMSNKMLEYQARQKGFYTLSEENKQEMEATIKEEYDYFFNAAKTAAEEEFAEDPDINVEERTKEIMLQSTKSAIGKEMNAEELNTFLREYFESSYAIQAMRDDFNAKITVSEEEVRAAYDEQLSSTKTSLQEDPGSYKLLQEEADTTEDGLPTLYTPEGYIRVRVISISPEDEISAEYATKKEQINSLTLELGELARLEDNKAEDVARTAQIKQELTGLEAEVNKLLEDYLAPSKKAIEEAYGKLESGADYTATMLEYGNDADFKDYTALQQKGKLLSAHTSEEDWPATVKTAALALSTPGAYSQILYHAEEGVYAYYIVQYVGNEPAGERSYESVRTAMEANTLSDKQLTEWDVMTEEWMADQSLITRYEDVINSIGADA